MQTDFFRKKGLRLCVFFFTTLFIACVGIYALRLSQMQVVECGRFYYFLVSTEQKVEVGAEFIRLDGGAGYLLEHNGGEYVALSVYLSEEDGVNVQKDLRVNGKETQLLAVGTNRLYFKGKEKQESALYVNALRILESYISLLNDCISRLEKGGTQESCKRLLHTLQKQFRHAAFLYAEEREVAEVFAKSAQKLSDIEQETVYLKDLRYLLCWQVEKYVTLCSAFAL